MTPSVVLAQEAALKGHRGICAGRDFELQQMTNYFQTQQAALNTGELDDADCLAMLIANAPGAGKTTLLEEFSMRSMGEELICIPLDAASLHMETWLIDSLTEYATVAHTETEVRIDNLVHLITTAVTERQYVPTATRVLIESATAITTGDTVTGGVPTTTTAEATANNRLLQSIADVAQQLRSRRQALASALRKGTPETATEALMLLDTTFDGHFLFIIDECHNLTMDVDNRGNVLRNIRAVTGPRRIRTGPRLGGGAVFAGLGDTVDALDGLHLTRAKVIWLSELDEESARATIEHQISKAAIGSARLQQVVPEWTERLTKDFTHWPHHCSAAGEMARRVLEMTEPGAPLHTVASNEREQLEWVCTATAKQIVQLYTDRWNVATDTGFESVARAVVALANRTANHIPKHSIPAVIRHAQARRITGHPLTEIGLYVEGVINRLVRSGILCGITESHDEGREVTHWKIGIPSLQRFVSENATDDVTMMAYATADAALAETAPSFLE